MTKNTWKRDPKKEKCSVGFRRSWRKIKVAVQDRTGWTQVVCGACYSGSKKGQWLSKSYIQVA